MKRAISLVQNENVVCIILFVITFCVYLNTMDLSVGFTDSGELATVICTLGIAHPTGYPLFTLFGRCWMMLPFPWEEIIRLNLLSAIVVSLAVSIFFKTALVFLRAERTFLVRKRKSKDINDRQFLLASTIASLTLGFSTTFWSQSTAIEVYALHLVLVLVTVWIFISGLEEQLKQPDLFSRRLMFFAFVLGLSFSNHMTTILLAPGFLWLYFRTFGFGKETFLHILKLIPFFFLGLSVYLYLPIRSATHPLLDWGHPATLERFFWHVSGKQFRVWMFSGWDIVQKQFHYYLSNFPSEFNAVAIVCIVVGLLKLWKQSRRLMGFLLLLFFTTILYAVNYDIFDIDSYFLLSYLVVGWIMVFGINWIFESIEDRHVGIRAVVIAMLFAIPLAQVVYNWTKVDETENNLPQQFVKKAYSDFKPNAVILATQWDYFISPSLYYQFVRHERSDITIIDKSLLQNRSWYFLFLERQAPWLIERTRESVRAFLRELDKFEHNEPFDFSVIQLQWQNLLADIVTKASLDHPVYVDGRIEQEFPSQFSRIPGGLYLQLKKTEDTLDYRSAFNHFIAWDRSNPVAHDFEQYYITMLIRDAEWLIRNREAKKARETLLEVLKIEPGNPLAIWMNGRIMK